MLTFPPGELRAGSYSEVESTMIFPSHPSPKFRVNTFPSFRSCPPLTFTPSPNQGTQSENPHNDYCQHFVDTGQRPQNFIRDTGLQDRFEEYPKLKELIRLKDDIIQKTNIPPMYLSTDLVDFELRSATILG